MISKIQIYPGVTLHCCQDRRFKQNTLSVQFCRPLKDEEAALSALLPAVLLRGCEKYPDMRAITLQLDDLYGAGMSSIVRITGNYHIVGIGCNFIEDRFAMSGDQVLAPLTAFLYEILRKPYTEQGVFSREYVESERKNLLAAIDSRKNDKRTYATDRMMELLCGNDPFSVPRLGRRACVEAVTAEKLWQHYEKVLKESPVELFYVGSRKPAEVAELVKPLFAGLDRQVIALPPQTLLDAAAPCDRQEEMEVSQGRLSMGFVSPVSVDHELFFAVQVFMLLYGGSTGKLFNVIREKLSLCYDIGAIYYKTKGIMTVHAGIDFDKKEQVRQEVSRLLQACCEGDFTEAELTAAKQGLIAGLQSSQDSPGAIESYYVNGLLMGKSIEPAEHIRAVEAVTAQQVRQAAALFKCNTVYFLKGVQE